MRLGVSYTSGSDFSAIIADVVALEEAGAGAVWLGESYGYDSVSALGALSAMTDRISLGFGVMPVGSRSPALVAMSAAGVDALSGGRVVLGLGVSGPQVMEGWHGTAFADPIRRTRHVVDTCRAIWRRERVSAQQGTESSGYRALKIINRPVRESIPIFLAASGDRNVELTAEIADGWLPAFLWPERIGDAWGSALAAGSKHRRRDLAPLQITTGVYAAVDEGLAEARKAQRNRLARYIGGMGTRDTNFYARLAGKYGFGADAAVVQERYMSGDIEHAARAVPDELVCATSLIGSASEVSRRLTAYVDAGVTGLNLSFVQSSVEGKCEQLAAVRSLVGSASGISNHSPPESISSIAD